MKPVREAFLHAKTPREQRSKKIFREAIDATTTKKVVNLKKPENAYTIEERGQKEMLRQVIIRLERHR